MKTKAQENIHPLCLKCKLDCKQTANVKIIICPKYTPIDGGEQGYHVKKGKTTKIVEGFIKR